MIAGFAMLMCVIGFFILRNLAFVKHHVDVIESSNASQSLLNPTNDETLENGNAHKLEVNHKSVFARIRVQAFNVAITFFITLSLFPGVTTAVTTETPALQRGWYQIIMLTMFMVFDFLGRTLPRWFQWISAERLWIWVVIRLVFYPLFILCVKSPVFAHDAIPIAIEIIFAFTNGYFGSTLVVWYGS